MTDVANSDALEAQTLQVFVSRALKKVLKEAPKKHVQLRQACVAVIGAPPSQADHRVKHASSKAAPRRLARSRDAAPTPNFSKPPPLASLACEQMSSRKRAPMHSRRPNSPSRHPRLRRPGSATRRRRWTAPAFGPP